MTLSVDELLEIRDLPDFLRTEHCYNDLQHAMLVILFRHGLKALRNGKTKLAAKIIDNISLYLYIHFLNEEEGLAFKIQSGLLNRENLENHSEQHIHFLDVWRDEILMPYKSEEASNEQTLESLSQFYNVIISHIDSEDIPTYGADVIAAEHTRSELARIAQTNMPMSPFMPGAYQALKLMDIQVANILNTQLLSPKALEPIGTLDLVPGVGRILKGTVGSLRDRFAGQTGGDVNATTNTAQIFVH